MDNSKILKEALGSSGEYSVNQYKVLNLLIDISVNNIAQASVKFIEEKTKVKASTIYFALKMFQKDGLIRKSEKPGVFEFQDDKIDFILESYKKKQCL